MTLSPQALPFFSCSSHSPLFERERFLCHAQNTLSRFDFCLLSDILLEWEGFPLLSKLLEHWELSQEETPSALPNSLHILSFNVRGLDLRLQEVILLANSFNFDVLILLETGVADLALCKQVFSSYHVFSQEGENSNGGVVVLVRTSLKCERVDFKLPNVCVVDICEEQTIEKKLRVIGVYAPDSRSWSWDNLSAAITNNCVLFGDFNVDLEKDNEKAESLTSWAESMFLSPYIPAQPTSLRSTRTIDYAFSSGRAMSIQTYEGNTTSDHKPVMSFVSTSLPTNRKARNVHWKVFTFFCEYVFPYWNRQWDLSRLDSLYEDYTTFLSLLIRRCTISFAPNKYRIPIPPSLRTYMSHTRALSFKQKRTGDLNLKHVVTSRRNEARKALKAFSVEQIDNAWRDRNSLSSLSTSFWSKAKSHMKSTSSSVQGFILPDGKVTKEAEEMSNVAANFHEEFFREPEVYRPHPFTDGPNSDHHWDNYLEKIPSCTIEEILEVVSTRKKKKSVDAHGLSNLALSALPASHWTLLMEVFNLSFSEGRMPDRWKDSRMLLLAKAGSICEPNQTRPISLLDVILKIDEKLFLTRFANVLERRGILPETQSGFRPKFRLQSRVLLFFEEISSLMSNSSPVGTVLVDFRSAFDQLWIQGCIGKLKRLGIPKAYLVWIENWLTNRRAFIEIKGKSSRTFPIRKSGPQGSTFTPLLFITFHSDLSEFLGCCSSHLFADDLAAIMAGSIGMKFSMQCLELERKLKIFFDKLEFYCVLNVQPINYKKTLGFFSARAVQRPEIELTCGEHRIPWEKEVKYLGYVFSPKMGFGAMIIKAKAKIRQRVAMINSFRLNGRTTTQLRKTLFMSYVLPVFTWLFPFFPLFTQIQQKDLSEFYTRCWRRVTFCLHWHPLFFMLAVNEVALEDRCKRYWEKYFLSLANSVDGKAILSSSVLNVQRDLWLKGEMRIHGLHRSKRFIAHTSLLEKCMEWCTSIPQNESTLGYSMEDIEILREFPETF